MLIRARFGKWVVVACMAALGACTSEGDGTVGSNELNVIFPNGTIGDFEIGRVTVDVQCTGATNDFFGVDPADATVFTTDLEFDNTPVTGGAEVYHAFMDLLGDCLFDVRAFEPDGELFCVGQGFTNVQPGDNQQVNVTLMCDISQNIDTGNADFIINNTIIMVGNFCPFVHSLETIPDDIPIVPSPLEIPNPALDGSQSCASDADCVGTCDSLSGLCDPVPNASEFQLCALDAADVSVATATISSCGNRCDVDPDPGNLSFTCTATLPDGTPSQGTFSDPALGGAGQDGDGNPTTYNGWCSNLALAGTGLSLPPAVGYFLCSDAEPGVTVTISCTGGDGDTDCNKTKTAEVTCAGTNLCVPLPDPECVDQDLTDCRTKGPCDPSTGLCADVDVDDGTTGCTGGNCTIAACVCQSGVCENQGLCDDAATRCDDNNDCTANDCDVDTGNCLNTPLVAGTTCDFTPGNDDGRCDGAGLCEEFILFCSTDPCEDNNPCTIDTCTEDSTDPTTGTCTNDPVPGDRCYDLSNSIFKAHNSLLDATGDGTGTPATDCLVPDTSQVPGANITGIEAQCAIVTSEGIGGVMTLTETAADVWDLVITQRLLFVIDPVLAIGPIDAFAFIQTDSTTLLEGTGDGAIPGSITLRDFTLPDPVTGDPLTFNATAAAVGNVLCCASTQPVTVDNFESLCFPPDAPLGGDLGATLCGAVPGINIGNNSLPLQNDPGGRNLPAVNANGTWDLGAGNPDPTGWYLVNPAPLAGNGTQFLSFGGVRLIP